MKKFKCILFDLDGTLIDTTPLILESFRHTFLYHFNEVKKDEELLQFLGIPLRKPFEDLYPDAVDILIKTYREYNEIKHDNYIGIFTGVVHMLNDLRKNGVILGVVTSKRRGLAIRGMKLFGIDEYMSVIVGMEDTEKHKPEGDPVLKAMELLGIYERDSVLYVGDSSYDILCAKNAGVASALAGWTYLPTDELLKLNPDLYLKTPYELMMC